MRGGGARVRWDVGEWVSGMGGVVGGSGCGGGGGGGVDQERDVSTGMVWVEERLKVGQSV